MRSRTADAGITEIPESALQEQVIIRETVSFLREQNAAAQPERPWFLCASFSRPHFPLTAPSRFSQQLLAGKEFLRLRQLDGQGDTAFHPMTVGHGERDSALRKSQKQEMMKARAAYFACIDYLDEILGDLSPSY